VSPLTKMQSCLHRKPRIGDSLDASDGRHLIFETSAVRDIPGEVACKRVCALLCSQTMRSVRLITVYNEQVMMGEIEPSRHLGLLRLKPENEAGAPGPSRDTALHIAAQARIILCLGLL
jgi:hypothetical protein